MHRVVSRVAGTGDGRNITGHFFVRIQVIGIQFRCYNQPGLQPVAVITMDAPSTLYCAPRALQMIFICS